MHILLPRVTFTKSESESHHLPWVSFPNHILYAPHSTSGWFGVLFRKSTKIFGLAFLRVSGRRGCLKRPLRASNLVGVSAAIPTSPPFLPQNPTAEIVARTPMLCRFAEWESLGNNNVLRPRGMAGAVSKYICINVTAEIVVPTPCCVVSRNGRV